MKNRANGFLVLLLGVVVGASGGSLITYHATRAHIQTVDVHKDLSQQVPIRTPAVTPFAPSEVLNPVADILPNAEPLSAAKPASVQPVTDDLVPANDNVEENGIGDETSGAYANSPEADVEAQESDDPYERLLMPSESNKVFNRFRERHAEFAKQEKTDEHAHIAQSFQDYFDLYVVSQDAQLDRAECRVNACELRISSQNKVFNVTQKVVDIARELEIEAKGMQGIDSYDVDLERKITLLLIEMEEFEG